MEIIDYLSDIPLFNGLHREHLKNLSSILIKKTFKPGEVIFLEKSESIGFYIIVSGRVKIYKLSSDGKEQILQFFNSGNPIGEVSVFTGEPFPANAEAVEPSTLLFCPRYSFISLIKNDPTLSLNMLGILSQRLQKFAGLIEDLSLKEVSGRLAAYLLYRSKNKNHINLDVSKSQLASMIGTIPETLSRILRKMTKHALIKTGSTRLIEILDRKGLQELAIGERRLE
ncbi:MAG: Crp/Fnr family transcriptional regulator [bacterium]